MFSKYISLAWRIIIRDKSYSIINIFGFALGLYIAIVISLYVIDDLTFDHYIPSAENIYRVVSNDNSKDWISAVTIGPLYEPLAENVPEVEAATRMTRYRVNIIRTDIDQPDSLAIRRSALITDSGFFGVFQPEIKRGEEDLPFSDPNAVYLTESTAEAVFGEDDPIGKSISISYIENGFVAGILNDPPTNTHLRYGAVIKMDPALNPLWWNSWENLTLTGYVRLTDSADQDEVEKKIVRFAEESGMTPMFTPLLQPLKDMHLKSSELRYDAFNLNKSEESVVFSLIAIGLMVMIIAVINFVNLSTARSSIRSKEIGIRKVSGANRSQLSIQFLSESVLYAVIAMLIALAALEISLPSLQPFLNKPLEFKFWQDPLSIFILVATALTVGMISGIYPSLVMSSFDPIKILKGKFSVGKKSGLLRQVLVVSQFAISIALIIGVMIVISQLKYLQHTNMGYSRDNIVVVPSPSASIDTDSDILKERVLQNTGISGAARIRQLPGNTLPTAEVYFDYREGDFGTMTDEIFVDSNFLDVMNIEIVSGRNFIEGSKEDSSSSVLVNETALKLSGWQDHNGKKLIKVPADGVDMEFNVIGVIKDIHWGRAKTVIEPMIIQYDPRSNILLVKAENVSEAEVQIENIYNELYPDGEFRSWELSEVFMWQFEDEGSFAEKIGVFAIIAIIIACLGLLGLAAFVTEKRTKEIGIRKVLGSSTSGVIFELVKDFSKWVLLSNVIAAPLALYVMNKWLQNFAYKTQINPLLFLAAAAGSLLIALLTVSIRTLHAANANPINSLKYE